VQLIHRPVTGFGAFAIACVRRNPRQTRHLRIVSLIVPQFCRTGVIPECGKGGEIQLRQGIQPHALAKIECDSVPSLKIPTTFICGNPLWVVIAWKRTCSDPKPTKKKQMANG
jgi:hypothetical protein